MNSELTPDVIRPPRARGRRFLVRALVGVAVLGALVFALSRVTPWPSALLIRAAFTMGGRAMSRALEPHVPANVVERLDERYDAADGDAFLDVFLPAPGTPRVSPTVVWIHGGAYIAGDKDEIANYMRVLAGRGVPVVSVEYSLAPGARYPKPLRQVNTALGFLAANATRLDLDVSPLVLAGDSAGAHLAAQLAVITTSPQYAAQVGVEPSLASDKLAGLVLFCGPYDLALMSFEGPAGWFLDTVVWSYLGGHGADAPRGDEFSVLRHVTAAFPPLFISAGNGDPLERHSHALAERARALGVQIDRLFFDADHEPALPHEYQFDLDSEAGREALERALAFLAARR